ncbi:MAG: type VI secretion system protein TssA [Planctomycetaceae bacterium]
MRTYLSGGEDMEWLSNLELDLILEPISDESPCGEDLRQDTSHNSVYYKIKSLRNEARTLERRRMRGESDVPPAETCWRALISLATETLSTQSKDLELCAYLIEALIREHDFPGLHDGFQLTRELCERYWDNVYPLPEAESYEARVVYLAGLNGVDSEGTLIRPILMCPLTAGQSVPPCSTAAYQHAQSLTSLNPEERQARIEEGAISTEMIEVAVKETSSEFLQNQRKCIQVCLEEFGRLTGFLDERCGEHSPHSSAITNALETCFDTLKYVAGHSLIDEGAKPADEQAIEAGEEESLVEGQSETGTVASVVPARIEASQIQDRSDAIRCVQLVADFFRKTEPHSPLSYAADQLARWGSMPLPELLTETLPDDGARSHLFTLMGIPEVPAHAESEY